MATKKYLKRVVKGPKSLHHVDPRTGKRYIAEPGEEVEVFAQQAASKAQHLIDPKVAAAQKATEEAVAEAAAEEVTAEPEEAKAKPKPKGGSSEES